jgi:hypothetical protein
VARATFMRGAKQLQPVWNQITYEIEFNST